MKNTTSKIIASLITMLMLLSIISVPVMAETDVENIILKKAEKNYMIYYKDICNDEFQFAFSTESTTGEEDLSFTNSVKDQLTEDALNVAYVDETLYNQFFSSNTVAYIWIKDMEDNTIVEADKIDLSNAIDDNIIELVSTTTIVNDETDRIEVDTTQTHETSTDVNGVATTVTIGKVVVKEKENAKYYYSLIKVSDENINAKELYSLAETTNITNTYESLSFAKRFYELYTELAPSTEAEWTPVENSEILQPETARTGDKYILYLKEESTVSADAADAADVVDIVDVKLLESVYEFNDRYEKEEDKVITETVKLPVTYDSIALIVVFAIVILAIIIVAILKLKSNKKEKNS